MVEVNNLTARMIDEAFLKGIARKVLAGENDRTADLSIALVGQEKIKELNRKYRKKNKATDTLSFKYGRGGAGEIIICPSEVRKNAEKYKTSFEKELTQALIHGILHLFGYDHEKTKKEAEAMEKKQNHYLKLFF